MSGRRRIVFDTSTLVSAALRVGSVPSESLLQALAFSTLCGSIETLAELDKVFKRNKFNRCLDLESRLAFVALVRRNTRLFSVTNSDMLAVAPSCRDPKDDMFLALAQIAESDAIVSSDEDLLMLHPWRQIPILTPAKYLADAEAK